MLSHFSLDCMTRSETMLDPDIFNACSESIIHKKKDDGQIDINVTKL